MEEVLPYRLSTMVESFVMPPPVTAQSVKSAVRVTPIGKILSAPKGLVLYHQPLKLVVNHAMDFLLQNIRIAFNHPDPHDRIPPSFFWPLL